MLGEKMISATPITGLSPKGKTIVKGYTFALSGKTDAKGDKPTETQKPVTYDESWYSEVLAKLGVNRGGQLLAGDGQSLAGDGQSLAGGGQLLAG